MKIGVEFKTVTYHKVEVDTDELPELRGIPEQRVKEDAVQSRIIEYARRKWMSYQSEEQRITNVIERRNEDILGMVDIYKMDKGGLRSWDSSKSSRRK